MGKLNADITPPPPPPSLSLSGTRTKLFRGKSRSSSPPKHGWLSPTAMFAAAEAGPTPTVDAAYFAQAKQMQSAPFPGRRVSAASMRAVARVIRLPIHAIPCMFFPLPRGQAQRRCMEPLNHLGSRPPSPISSTKTGTLVTSSSLE